MPFDSTAYLYYSTFIMFERQMTLQSRIITMVVISAFLLISVFTFIQLKNQFESLTRHNRYIAQSASFIVRNNLETILALTKNNDVIAALQRGINALEEAQIIDEAVVFDRNGEIVASTRSNLNGQHVRYRDQAKWIELEASSAEDWFSSSIDPITRKLNMYLRLGKGAQEPMRYTAKISFSLGNFQDAFAQIYIPVIVATLFVLLANIVLAYILSRTVVGPIKMLNEVTKIIARGDLSVRARIKTNDELEELGETFNNMTAELVKMRERAENANPLTKLPGNLVIQEQIERRIQEEARFVVIYADLDNFKAFNDKYGIARGDEAIKLTASIMREAVKHFQNSNDFLGHEGGDDFILLTTPEQAQATADFIIREFEARIRKLYNPEDLNEGAITSVGRDGTERRFPIMTISLAGVSNDHRPITSYAEVTNIAAEVKKKVKSIGQSIFMLDRRQKTREG